MLFSAEIIRCLHFPIFPFHLFLHCRRDNRETLSDEKIKFDNNNKTDVNWCDLWDDCEKFVAEVVSSQTWRTKSKGKCQLRNVWDSVKWQLSVGAHERKCQIAIVSAPTSMKQGSSIKWSRHRQQRHVAAAGENLFLWHLLLSHPFFFLFKISMLLSSLKQTQFETESLIDAKINWQTVLFLLEHDHVLTVEKNCKWPSCSKSS